MIAATQASGKTETVDRNELQEPSYNLTLTTKTIESVSSTDIPLDFSTHPKDCVAEAKFTEQIAALGRLSGGTLASLPPANTAFRDDVGLIGVKEALNGRHRSLGFAKRTIDLFIATMALLCFAPVFALCALLVKLSSKGPVFFRQSRLGRNSERFVVYKFRTMRVDSANALQEYLESNPEARQEWEKTHKLRRDPRVTTVGRTLRRFSLDELPQLLNILKGDMSCVGPRPIVDSELEQYKESFSRYCAVRPGLTGLWQVSGRSDTSFAFRTQLDCQYVETWSFRQDLAILARTLGVVISAAGAY